MAKLDYLLVFFCFCPHKELPESTIFIKISLFQVPVGSWALFCPAGLHSATSHIFKMEAAGSKPDCLIQPWRKSAWISAILADFHFFHGGQLREMPPYGPTRLDALQQVFISGDQIFGHLLCRPRDFWKAYNGGISTNIGFWKHIGLAPMATLDYLLVFFCFCPHEELPESTFFIKIYLFQVPVG